MVPIEYRDPQTEEVLRRGYEESAPARGERVVVEGFGECEVLYRWRSNPFAQVVYLRRVRAAA